MSQGAEELMFEILVGGFVGLAGGLFVVWIISKRGGGSDE
jgi:hypothetical protein